MSIVLTSRLKDPEGQLAHFPAAWKRQHSDSVLAAIREALRKPDAVQSIRDEFVRFTSSATQFWVLLNTPETAEFAGITGELGPHIEELATLNANLKEFIYGLPEAPVGAVELMQALTAHTVIENSWMVTYNYVRILLGDYHKDDMKDWAKPFMLSQGIFWEYLYRQELNMPPNIVASHHDGSFSPGFARFTQHACWPEYIESGEKYPRLKFESSWEDVFGEVSPFTGVTF
ncbi:hypothetical protein ACFOLJ_05910 [Rugamonas sp. CCM 8940]|uniref:hypothetical protein n=1 Tax=Rugamonas sp. CCM 8940 TaxID=2765359 RepID=UPI0018F453A4|nr:hypothetical protein [Rugamonas sp. CCM 8940]MBJ7312743.1 hypothetical protein [Rugamonas sp. CCM 8940]